MRTTFKVITSLLLAAMLLVSCVATEVSSKAVTEAASGNTSVVIYDNGSEKLHVLYSNDALGDVSFIVEGKDELVGIELPAFTEGLEEWKSYVESLGKPMNNIFIAEHVTGKSYVEGMNVLGSESAAASIESGSVFATTDGLYQTFGPDFHGGDELVLITEVVPSGKVEIAGIEFKVMDNGNGYDLAIPGFDAVYTHMLGKYTHSIITSASFLDSYLDVLEGYRSAEYQMILSAHSGVEGQDAVAEKISYVETLKKLYAENSTSEEFIDAVNSEYPDYAGANYLEMSAGYLYN